MTSESGAGAAPARSFLSSESFRTRAHDRERRRRIRSVSRSVIFDLAYYEVQAGQHFATRRGAVIHFIDYGIAADLSPTPFFQKEWYQFHASLDHDRTLTTFLFGRDSLASTAPTFDAHRYAVQLKSTSTRRVSTARAALEDFLRRATDTSPLPVHVWCAGTPTVAQGRARALETAGHNVEKTRLLRPRLSSTQDGYVEAEWWSKESVPSTALVSVVLPVRNRPDLIAATIRSVMAQSHRNWELIVVDDGSTDETPAVVSSFSAVDARVTLIRQAPTGVCAARNVGLHASSGDYVAFIDSDNTWTPRILERSVAALEQTDAVAVHSVVHLVDEEGTSQYLAFEGDRDDLLAGGNFVDLNTLVSRRTALVSIGGFDEGLKRWVDYDLVIRLFAVGDPMFLNFIGVEYSHNRAVGRISTTEPLGWEQVVLSKYLMDWPSLEDNRTERHSGFVSIVMLTYADWRMTLPAVKAILEVSGETAFELIVLDNGSPSSVGEVLSSALLGDDRVTYVPLMRNVNFALGSNLGFARTSGELVAFVNNDTCVSPGWLDALAASFAADDRIGAAQSLIIGADSEILDTGIEFPPPSHEPLTRTGGRRRTDLTEAVSGVAVMFRAAEFIGVRGFDPIFSNGCEDADISLRMKARSGCTFSLVNDSIVTHFQVFSPGRFASVASNERLFSNRWLQYLSDTALTQRVPEPSHQDGYV